MVTIVSLYATEIIQVFNNLSQPPWEKTRGHLAPTAVDSNNVHSYFRNRKTNNTTHSLNATTQHSTTALHYNTGFNRNYC